MRFQDGNIGRLDENKVVPTGISIHTVYKKEGNPLLDSSI